jgi:FkbM family methyltransferase
MTDTPQIAEPYRLVNARHGCMLVNPNDVYVGGAILRYGEYGELEFRLLRQLLVRPGKIVEIGANIGSHTVALAKLAAGRGLVAFEPQPVIFQNLCANLSLNGIRNVQAWPWACGERSETLYFPPQDYAARGNFGAVSLHEERKDTDIAVPAVKLQDVLLPGPVALLKIDVEGMELEALKGASEILAASRPVLYVENDRPKKSQALIYWLQQQNYRLWWHIPPLFNPQNFFDVRENIYGNMSSFNMLCLPRDQPTPVEGLIEVENATFHPLAQNR